jgi:hypothetical protein
MPKLTFPVNVMSAPVPTLTVAVFVFSVDPSFPVSPGLVKDAPVAAAEIAPELLFDKTDPFSTVVEVPTVANAPVPVDEIAVMLEFAKTALPPFTVKALVTCTLEPTPPVSTVPSLVNSPEPSKIVKLPGWTNTPIPVDETVPWFSLKKVPLKLIVKVPVALIADPTPALIVAAAALVLERVPPVYPKFPVIAVSHPKLVAFETLAELVDVNVPVPETVIAPLTNSHPYEPVSAAAMALEFDKERVPELTEVPVDPMSM